MSDLPGSLRNSLEPDDITSVELDSAEDDEHFTKPEAEEFGRDFARCLDKSPSFRNMWSGGRDEQHHLKLRLQVSTDSKGRLLYNGRLYKKNTWCRYFVGDVELYGPPKVIRQMGRPAREQHNPVNSNPEISILTAKGEVLRLDACPCGGELLKDRRGVLYCSECFIIYE